MNLWEAVKIGALIKTETVIYLDVLVILNIYVSYFLLLSTAKVIAEKITRWRLFCASLLGGIFSLMILFEIEVWQQALIKLLMGGILLLTAFRIINVKHIVKCATAFFLVNFLYGGLMFALWFFVAPSGMTYKNGVAYFNITAIELLLSTVLAYFLVTVICNFLNKRIKTTDLTLIEIGFCGNEIAVNGFCDTGNKLSDTFSGLPVIVCEYETLKPLFPQKLLGYFKDPLTFDASTIVNTSNMAGLKLLPIDVVGAKSLLPAFKPDKISICGKERAAIVAVCDKKLSLGEYHAIVNPILLY